MGIDVCMEIENDKPISDEFLARLNHRLYSCFGGHMGKPPLSRASQVYYDNEEDYTLENGLELNTCMRFYSDGYERGQIHIIIGIAELIEAYLPNCKIYYSGDCYHCRKLFDKETREFLKQHFYKVGHDPYLGAGDFAEDGNISCPECGFKTWKSGSSNGGSMFSCTGCDFTTWKTK